MNCTVADRDPRGAWALKVIEMAQLRPAATAVVQVPRLTVNAPGRATVTALIGSGPEPLLVTCMVPVAVRPALTFPRSSEADFSVIWAIVPVPANVTDRGAAGSLLVSTRLAVRVPGAVGAKRTATTQLAPGASEAQAAPVTVVKSAPAVPV